MKGAGRVFADLSTNTVNGIDLLASWLAQSTWRRTVARSMNFVHHFCALYGSALRFVPLTPTVPVLNSHGGPFHLPI